uniref:Competence protein n=1 Tax=Haemonchus placei TaxID=6290 RepID=A0A0N4WXX4_HAEPC
LYNCVQSEAKILMLPKDGISTCAFPFWNQQGYEQPFVMLKITQLSSGKVRSYSYIDTPAFAWFAIPIEMTKNAPR